MLLIDGYFTEQSTWHAYYDNFISLPGFISCKFAQEQTKHYTVRMSTAYVCYIKTMTDSDTNFTNLQA